jgi:hypothetical protein
LALSVKNRLKSKKKLCISVSKFYQVSQIIRLPTLRPTLPGYGTVLRKTYLLLGRVRDTVDHVVEFVPHGLGCDTSGSRTEVLQFEVGRKHCSTWSEEDGM